MREDMKITQIHETVMYARYRQHPYYGLCNGGRVPQKVSRYCSRVKQGPLAQLISAGKPICTH